MTLPEVAGFDWQGEVVGVLDLVNINTPDGDFGFLIGETGMIRDVNGKEWWGSSLISVSDLQSSINGIAPTGSLSLSYFQDPALPELQNQVQDMGVEYIRDRPITFYVQPLRSQSELMAPVVPPMPWLTRTMRRISYKAEGAQNRQMTVHFESPFEGRKRARRVPLTPEGHAKLIGAPNPSLEFRPTDTRTEEPLFG